MKQNSSWEVNCIVITFLSYLSLLENFIQEMLPNQIQQRSLRRWQSFRRSENPRFYGTWRFTVVFKQPKEINPVLSHFYPIHTHKINFLKNVMQLFMSEFPSGLRSSGFLIKVFMHFSYTYAFYTSSSRHSSLGHSKSSSITWWKHMVKEIINV
jgi:hypothetical protein